jgi:hypothetical protein
MDDLFPSKYLKAVDVAHEPIVTINRVIKEKLKNNEGVEEFKPILYFGELEKGIVLNKTNANIIKELYGEVIEEWVGKRIQLCSRMVEAFGESQAAIRVKEEKPPADMATLLKHYEALYEKALKLKIDHIKDYVVPANITENELVEIGKELRAKVEAAEAFQ